MSSRDKILKAVQANQPALQQLPDMDALSVIRYGDTFDQFVGVLKSIGGNVVEIKHIDEIYEYVKNNFNSCQNFVTTLPEINQLELLDQNLDPHTLENIEVAVLGAQFGVAENGAVWLTEQDMKIRALPFICQHLSVLIQKKDILNNMPEAYAKIAADNYGFGVFIAGPSKTADIEQSLVLGAHGPRTMTVFVAL
jgi:L-lactate dehydrogenase complex protein LldG